MNISSRGNVSPLPPTLRNPSGCSPSLALGSLNTVYAVRYAHPNCAFGTTSHTPKPLYEIENLLVSLV